MGYRCAATETSNNSMHSNVAIHSDRLSELGAATQKFCGGNRRLMGNLGSPKVVDMRRGFATPVRSVESSSLASCLGSLKATLAIQYNYTPIKSNEQGTKVIAKPNTDMRIVCHNI